MAKLNTFIFSSTWRGRNAQAAHGWAAAGFPVFPCRSTDSGEYKAKRPLVEKWEQRPVRDAGAIVLEWRRFKDAIPGVHVGAGGYLVVDLDAPKKPGAVDGRPSWADLIEGRDMAPIPTVCTPGGGFHLWFKMPAGLRLGNRLGKLKKLGIDIRGIGGYVIAPGATLPDGRSYQLAEGSPALSDAPELPAWLVEMIEDKADAPPQAAEVISLQAARERVSDNYAFTALDREISTLASTGAGGRNHALNSAALRLYGLVQQGSLDRSTVDAALREACDQNGSIKDDGPAQFRATCQSAWGAAQRKPRHDAKPLAPQYTAPANMAPAACAVAPATYTTDDIEAAIAGLGYYFDGDTQPERRTAIIKRFLPRDGTGIVGGQSGAGKSFLAVDMAVAIATGQAFFGEAIRTRVGVLYYAAEGGGSISNRIAAAKLARGVREQIAISYTANVGNMLDPANIKQKISDIKAISPVFERRFGVPVGIIVIDTVSAAFHGIDDNSSKDAAICCRVLADIAEATGCFVIAVHHYGKDSDRGLRGSSAWRANVDQVLAVTGECDANRMWKDRVLIIDKNRDGEEGPLGAFDLHRVEIGRDADGDPVVSMTIKAMLERVLGEQKHSSEAAQSEKFFVSALRSALAEASANFDAGIDGVIRGAHEGAIKSRFDAMWDDRIGDASKVRERQRGRFRRGCDAAIRRGLAAMRTTFEGDVYWLTE